MKEKLQTYSRTRDLEEVNTIHVQSIMRAGIEPLV